MATGNDNYKAPPVLDSEEGYAEWRTDLDVWMLLTELPKKKQGPAIFLNLHGKAREIARKIAPAVIGGDDGVTQIINKLETFYLKDKNTRTFLAFREFYNLRRASGTSITDFLVTFETLHDKLVKLDIDLPQGVQAFFLLTAANVSDEKESLARTTCGDMTYDNMKKCLQKIFNDPSAVDNNIAPPIKCEPAFAARHRYNRDSRDNRSYRGRGGGNRVVGNYRTNGRDKDGNVLRCFKCGSDKHFARECRVRPPQNSLYVNTENISDSSQPELPQQIHITLLSNSNSLDTLVNENLGIGILDTGCTKTVVGKFWLDSYFDSLQASDKALIIKKGSNTSFCFGDGAQVIARESVKFPACIGGKKVYIESCVVDNQIPLLLSRSSMKNAGLKLDTTTDSAIVLGERVKLVLTNAGHYGLPLSNFALHPDNKLHIVLHTNNLNQCSKSEKRKKALKLHKQMCHASKDRLLKLVKESRCGSDKEFIEAIEECCDTCELCLKYRRPPLGPVVGLRLADRFNEVVAIDLKEIEKGKEWIIHMIDTFSRYSATSLIKCKKGVEIVEKVCSMWITHFGAPKKILTDNGKEFSNEVFHELNEKFNVETMTTAAESPFSNGICERHHTVLYEAMQKTIEECGCSKDMALAYATAAKNSLYNRGGFSPNQLVFGANPNFPSVLSDEVPALESECMNDVVRKNLNCLHAARKSFIQAESSERVRRALKSKVRTYCDVNFEMGDKVLYKRQNYKGWKGPAKVIGIDNQMILIRHGGIMYRCHPCHLMKFPQNHVEGKDLDEKVEDIERCVDKRDRNLQYENVPAIERETEEEPVDIGILEQAETENPEENINIQQDEEAQLNETPEEDIVIYDNSVKPSRNELVKYRLGPDDEWREVKVMSFQPKQTGTYQDWINVQNPREQY